MEKNNKTKNNLFLKKLLVESNDVFVFQKKCIRFKKKIVGVVKRFLVFAIIFIWVFSLCPIPHNAVADMAVVFDETNFSVITDSSLDSASGSHTVPSGTDLLVVMLQGWVTGEYDAAGSPPSSIVWNNGSENQSLTRIALSTSWGNSQQGLWYLANPNVGAGGTITISGGDATVADGGIIDVLNLSGVDLTVGTSGIRDYKNTQADSNTTISLNPTTTTTDLIITQWSQQSSTSTTGQTYGGTSGTQSVENGTGYNGDAAFLTTSQPTAASQIVTFLLTSAGNYPSGVSISVAALATSVSLDQEGFAFGDDDGSETSHTLNAQDTNIIESLGTKTLRTIIDTDGDAPSNAYKLKYQKNGSGGYINVPVGAGGSASPSPSSGDVTESGDNGTTSAIKLDYPAYSDGDLVVLHINAIQYSSGTQGINYPSGPNGETIVVFIDNNTPGNQYDTGMSIAYFVGDGSHSAGTLAITSDLSQRWTGATVLVSAGEFDTSQPLSTEYSANSSHSDGSVIMMSAFTADTDDGGGQLIAFVGADQDPISGTDTGWTDIVTTDRGRSAIKISTRDSNVGNSESIGTADWSIGGDAWGVIGYIIRPAVVSNEIYISTSSNVVSGGEPTTTRLTAPSGKSGNFTTGRRWDDENGSDSIDIVENYYTELEWVLTTQSPVATDDYFEFRVYDGDTALDIYTLIPKWTIGTAMNISISIEPNGTISYGDIPLNNEKDTTATGTDETKTARNDGSVAEDFNIKTSHATGGTQWSVGSSAGVDIFTHSFSTNSGTSWEVLQTYDGYESLATNVLSGNAIDFDLKIHAPTATSDYNQKNIIITIQAVAH